MKYKYHSLFPLIMLLGMTIAAAMSGCAPTVSAANRQDKPLLDQTAAEAAEPQAPEVTYQSFALPGPEAITFELPEGWDFWGNGGYLSPDDGTTLAGLRQVWLVEGQDVSRMLFNEDAIVLEETALTVAAVKTYRYTVETSLKNASTGEVFFHAFELVYTFPAPDGEAMAGVFVSVPSLEELPDLAPIAEHMIETLRYGAE